MESDLRRWMRLVEDAYSAEQFISDSEAAVSELSANVHVSFVVLNPTTVEVENIYARPYKAGWGSKAMNLICDHASDRAINLVVRLPNKFDQESMDEDAPSERQLVMWYSRFGFLITSHGSHIKMERKPINLTPP